MAKIKFTKEECLTFYEGFRNYPHNKVRLKMVFIMKGGKNKTIGKTAYFHFQQTD